MESFVKSVLLRYAQYWQSANFRKFVLTVSMTEIMSLKIKEPKVWGSSSPKLGKVLGALGLNNKQVSEVCAFVKEPGELCRVTGNPDEMRAQGNSVYYSSCQATDERSKFGAMSEEYNQVDGDMLHVGKSLFLWVVGQPMSIDGKGYRARAKVRVVLSEDKKRVIGLFVDKIYGQRRLLVLQLPRLQALWDSYSAQRGWATTPLLQLGKGMRGFCPSAANGYQDTLDGCEASFTELEMTPDFDDVNMTRSFDFQRNGVHTWSTTQISLIADSEEMIRMPNGSESAPDFRIDQRSRKALHAKLAANPAALAAVKAGAKHGYAWKYRNCKLVWELNVHKPGGSLFDIWSFE